MKAQVIVPSMRKDGLDRLLDSIERPKDVIAIIPVTQLARTHKCRIYWTKARGYWRCMNEVIEIFRVYSRPFMWLADDAVADPNALSILEECYKENFPDGLGMVAANDMNLQHGAAAFAITTTKWLWVLFGQGFFPGIFGHNFLDTLVADRSKDLDRYVYCEDAVFEHMHYSLGKSEKDDVYRNAIPIPGLDKIAKDAFDAHWEAGGKLLAAERIKSYG